ncbi:MAG TPA: signal transduction protein [Planktothrix sp. UBA8407]|jgi:Predicted NTPase (NACHT family)|nr:signal transduction protein [Planktothrix sp. UBA8407]HBK21145.1 signal transduction protein [Planktothrix sp. UBA10369]
MQKLIACLPILATTALNGLMCWGINQMPGKSNLPIPLSQEVVFWLTVGSVVGIAFFSTQSSGTQRSLETNNRDWLVGLPPVIGSVVLFGLLKGGHLPSELSQYAGYASLLLFVMGTLLPTLMAFLKMRQTNIAIPATTTGLSPQAYRNRQALLNKVKNYWVKGVLEGSLSNRARIELGLEERLDAVQLDWETPEQPRRSLPKGTKAINQFDKMGKGCTLLILGAPGAGKTTTLLELTSELINRAEQDINLLIPVVFNLSSWAATKKQTIAEWLVEELDSRYQIPEKFGADWVKNEQLLLLLDGLDEVSEDRRNHCVVAINEFKQSHGVTEIVVCSRIKDYEALSSRLKFQGAIFIEDLTLEEINDYFDNAADKLQGVKAAWINDDVLQELTKTPLILSVIAIAYEGMSIEDLPKMTLKERRKHLFNKYIEKMFNRRKNSCRYSNKLTITWLTWLAKVMSTDSQTVFLIERLQPKFMSDKEKSKYRTILFIIPLLLGFILMIFLSTSTIINCLIFLVLFRFGMILSTTSTIKPMLSFDKEVIELIGVLIFLLVGGGLIGGGLGFIFARYVFHDESVTLFYAAKITLIGTFIGTIPITFFLLFNFEEFVIESIVKPNQGIWTSLKNGLFLLFIFIFVLGIFSILVNFSLVWSTAIAVLLGIFSSGIFACIQHFALRIFLYRSGKIPWNYARFLDYATERIFLQKVGGGYIFIHRLLLDHFASLESDD